MSGIEQIPKDFYEAAYLAVDAERNKIQKGFRTIFDAYLETGKILNSESKDMRILADWYASAFLQQLDIYIMHKKETVRRNPECGAGSLFSMPSDESELEEILKIAEENLRQIVQ